MRDPRNIAKRAIETPMMGLLRSADVTQIVKYVAKMVAHRHGQTVTFMPKPLYGEAGSGMHFHQHLFKRGKNVFYSADGYGKLSQMALWYIGGLLQHGGMGLGPIGESIFAWTAEQRKAIKPLPSSLCQAIETLETDHEFLLCGGVFDDGQISEWIKVNSAEHHVVLNRPHPFETELYLDA